MKKRRPHMGSALCFVTSLCGKSSAAGADEQIVEVGDCLIDAHRDRLEPDRHRLARETIQAEGLDCGTDTGAGVVGINDLWRGETTQHLRGTAARNHADRNRDRTDDAPALEADHLARGIWHHDLLLEEPIGAIRHVQAGERIAELWRDLRETSYGTSFDADLGGTGNGADSIESESIVEVAVLDK